MKKIIVLLLSVLSFFLVCTAAGMTGARADEHDIKNVKVSESGILTWDPYEGATRYWLIFDSYAVEPVNFTFDLNEAAHRSYFPSGTYTFSLVA